MAKQENIPAKLHHRATRSGFFFRFLRNIAITVSGLGCIVAALGGLGVLLILGRMMQFGIEGLTIGWEHFSNLAVLTMFQPAIGLIILGILVVLCGLIINWIVTKPVFHPRDETQQKDQRSE